MLQAKLDPVAVILERLRIVSEKIDILSVNQSVILAEIQKPTGKSGVKKKPKIELVTPEVEKPEIKQEIIKPDEEPEIKPDETLAIKAEEKNIPEVE